MPFFLVDEGGQGDGKMKTSTNNDSRSTPTAASRPTTTCSIAPSTYNLRPFSGRRNPEDAAHGEADPRKDL